MTGKEKIKPENMSQLASYREYLRSHPKLAYLSVDLIDRCNLSCLHCESSCSPSNCRYLDTKLILDVLRKVAEDYNPRNVMICFTGGEPLLHSDFFRIAAEVVAVAFPWGMTTNATLITPDTAFRLKETYIDKIKYFTQLLKSFRQDYIASKGR